MGKDSDQPSGVVGGTMDVSVQPEQEVAHTTDAGTVLAHRRLVASRVKKLESLRAKRVESGRVTPTGRGKR
jgi:hypothetical protein